MKTKTSTTTIITVDVVFVSQNIMSFIPCFFVFFFVCLSLLRLRSNYLVFPRWRQRFVMWLLYDESRLHWPLRQWSTENNNANYMGNRIKICSELRLWSIYNTKFILPGIILAYRLFLTIHIFLLYENNKHHLVFSVDVPYSVEGTIGKTAIKRTNETRIFV